MDEPITALLHPSAGPQLLLLAVALVTVGLLFGGYFRFKKPPMLPRGSLGWPLFGESIGFLRAHKQDKAREWVETRIARHGPVFKTSLMGKPTVVVTGPAGNRFLFSADDSVITSNQPSTVSSIMGKYNTFELTGKEHKLVRGAMVGFLKPESLRRYVGGMDSIIKQQILQEFDRKDSLKVVPFLKRLAFNVTCDILFAIPSEKQQDQLFEDFKTALKGMWALQLNFPTTTYHRAISARRRIYDYLSALVEERRQSVLEEGSGAHENDVISAFVRLRDENGGDLSEDMVVDNLMTLMIGSHDTSTILLSQLVRLLARDKDVYKKMLEEQERVLGEKEGRDGSVLTWNDIQKMKYTWRVAQELLRITPPAFGNFRRAVTDTSFGGFDIPKGWQIFWVSSGTHMDGSIFPEPEKFDPSRFEAASKNYPPYTYIPFGAGPHVCPGSEFARIEVLLVMHHLVINYEWSEMVPNEPITRQPMPLPAMGLPIKIRRKGDHEDLLS